MALVKAIAVVILLACIPLIQGEGQVIFYNKPNFDGLPYVVSISETQVCLNLRPCHDNKPMSVKWNNLPTNGKARIAFYTRPRCSESGKYYEVSRQDNDNFPTDFTDVGLNGKVSSLMILESGRQINRVEDAPCMLSPWFESKNSTAK